MGEAGIEFVEGRDGKYGSVTFSLSADEVEEVRNEIRDMYARITDVSFWRDVFSGKIRTLTKITSEGDSPVSEEE